MKKFFFLKLLFFALRAKRLNLIFVNIFYPKKTLPGPWSCCWCFWPWFQFIVSDPASGHDSSIGPAGAALMRNASRTLRRDSRWKRLWTPAVGCPACATRARRVQPYEFDPPRMSRLQQKGKFFSLLGLSIASYPSWAVVLSSDLMLRN